MRKLKTGDKVKLTGKFLRNSGQMVGGEGQSTWTVRDCPCPLCRDGRFVAVDQSSETGDPLRGPVVDPAAELRHINAANLYRVGTLTTENCP